MVTADEQMNVPPAVPPLAVVVIRSQVNETLMLMFVLPLATRMSVAPRLAQVRNEPRPSA